MKHKLSFILLVGFLLFAASSVLMAQANGKNSAVNLVNTNDSMNARKQIVDTAKNMPDTISAPQTEPLQELSDTEEEQGIHQSLKVKFIEGNAGFMSLVALALVLGLAFCIERIIYLSLSEINAKRFMVDLDAKINAGDIEGAKQQCRNTRGPVASICYQGLARINESIDNIERSIVSYGTVQSANLEKGCSWITLFIVMAPSLGFLGTVIGMVMAFDQIEQAGDISAPVVASGMKVALHCSIGFTSILQLYSL